ncbi:MAG: EAL domain-containing protein [Gammaproteobacteria bacterium]|nr:EAL domain-containing protein [Gammaproteobacteria bacterium]
MPDNTHPNTGAATVAPPQPPRDGLFPAPPAVDLWVLDHIGDPVLIFDDGAGVVHANRAAARALGDEADALTGRHAGDIDTQWTGERWRDLWAAVGREQSVTFESEYQRARGVSFPVEAKAGLLTHAGRDYVCIVARDISNRRAAEAHMAGVDERYRQLVEGSLQGISVDAFDNRPLFVNQAFAELYGYDLPAEIMQLGSLQALAAPEDRARIEDYARRRKRGEPVPSVYEFTGIRKDGSRITVLCSAKTILWEGFPAVQAALMDVTDRHRIAHAEKEQEAARARLVGAMEASSEGFALFDADDRLYYTNRRYRDMMFGICDILVPGTTFREILDVSIRRRAIPEARGCEQEWIETRMARHRNPAGATEHYRADSGIWARIHEQRLEDGATFVVVSDITRAKQTEREIADKTEQLEAAYENMDQGIVMLDREHRIVAFNQRWARTLAAPGLDLEPGLPIRDVVERLAREGGYGEGAVEELVAARMQKIADARPYRFIIEHGEGRFLEVRGRPTPSGGHVITQTDITETHLLSRELSWQASHDALTGLANRTGFETALEQLIRGAGKGAAHALCYLDLDQFKVINDTCGHLAGDELMRRLGGLLPEQVRERDIIARLGGDEFGLLLENCSIEDAARIAGKVCEAIDGFRFMWQGKMFRVGASIGVVPITRYSDNVSDILSCADTACYAAKDQGGNRVHVYHADDSDLARRRGDMHWVADLNRSLERNDFILYKQPILSLEHDDAEQRYEILLRLDDGSGRLYEPKSFLRPAERFGLMVKLDRWVISTMLGWLDDMETKSGEVVTFFINISGMSLREPSFRDFVIERLGQRGPSRFRICFEITETAAVASLSSAAEFIEQVRGLGHFCALDDFGSGLSSFAYLKNLPVDYVKIDGQFVRDINTDPIDLAMVKSITEIARIMNKRTIAEFAETIPVLDRLRDIGVDFAQGYCIGYPEPLMDL